MVSNQVKFLSSLAIVSFLSSSIGLSAFAHGPLDVNSGTPSTYSSSMEVRYDQGTLGQLSNGDAITLINDLLDDWEIPTSSISIIEDTPNDIGQDLNGSTNGSTLSLYLGEGSAIGFTPIIFDTDGQIIVNKFGSGLDNLILGFAGPRTSGSTIVESIALFNGKFYDGVSNGSNPEVSLNTFKGTIIHELGHAIGLDHSQINVNALNGGASQTVKDSVPLMFPIAVNSLFALRVDDAAGVGTLYPNSTFNSTKASIAGRLFRSDGTTPIRGANVIARRTDDPTNEAVSCVSDYLIQNNGAFKLSGLSPGTYRIEIEPISTSFTQGSSVGPYSETGSDLSFQNPVSFGYFTGVDQPISNTLGDAQTITVSAGQNVTGQNFIGAFTGSSSSSSSSTSGGTISEIEPNDTIVGAQSITSLPVTITGTADESDSGEVELTSGAGNLVLSDLFRFTQTSKGAFMATLDNESTGSDDLDLVLLDSTASTIIADSSLTGNSDESIDINSLNSGTYLIGVGAFSGSANYSLALEGESVEPTLSINQKFNKDTIVLSTNSNKSAKLMLNVKGTNITSKTACTVTASYTDDADDPISDSNLDEIRFKTSFMLSKKKKRAPIAIKIKGKAKGGALNVVQYIKENYDPEINIHLDVSCDNGTSDTYSIRVVTDATNLRIVDPSNYRHIQYRGNGSSNNSKNKNFTINR